MVAEQGSGTTGDFGELLLRFRLAAGLSREALAERAGLSATGIGALERGQRRAPHVDTVRRLSDALQLSPDDAAALAAAVVRHRTPQAQVAAPRLSVTNPPTLIAPLAPLVGRGWDVAVVCGLLRADDTRFVSLTGPGGVGKTRLALAVAEHLARELPEPVVLVDLAPIRDPKLVWQTVLAQLGLREERDRALERLLQALPERRMLILLDNFEQVMPAARDIPALLAAVPELRLLVTSRSALGLRSEHVYPVSPLDLPDLDHLPPLADLAEIPAVALFLARAQAVSPTFELTEENAAAVAELCVHLDGLPLAIKLAAARMHLLSPKMVLDRLEHRFSLLRWDALDLPERQQTLEAAIAWSYELLAPQEQALLRRLGVFVGGFTLEAAEAVMADTGIADFDVLEGLSSLVAGSLVFSNEDVAGHRRYGLLESIRDYALQRLADAGEVDDAYTAHARYFVDMVEQEESRRGVGEQRVWLLQLEGERQNLNAARRWLEEHPDIELETRLTGAIGVLWLLGGSLEERNAWAKEALRLVASDRPLDSTAALDQFIGLGEALVLLGEADQARAALHKGLASARELGVGPSVARCLASLGWCEITVGQPEIAEALLAEALGAARDSGDVLQAARTLLIMGETAILKGQFDRSLAYLEESLDAFRSLGHLPFIGFCLTGMALAHARVGDSRRAVGCLRESLDICRQVHHPYLLVAIGERTALVGDPPADDVRMAQFFGAIDTIKRTRAMGLSPNPVELAEFENSTDQLEQRLGTAAFRDAWDRGSILSFEETLTLTGGVLDGLTEAMAGLEEYRAVGSSRRKHKLDSAEEE
jgi:predicted ATPase/transcriptional regulator with XRE-family HTH domain